MPQSSSSHSQSKSQKQSTDAHEFDEVPDEISNEQGSAQTEEIPTTTTSGTETDCETRAAEYLAGWKRARADYENLQRDTAVRLQQIRSLATEDVLQDLLPLVDYFDYAFAHIPADLAQASWLTGIEHIRTNLLKILEERGITMMHPVGQPFDPTQHEAVQEVEGTDQASGTVVQQVAAGFVMNGKVIRCAKVNTAK